MTGNETLDERMNRLAAEMRQFGRKVREDVRNLKWVKSPTAAAETREETLARVHNNKPVPSARGADPDAIPVTEIRMNDRVIEDFGDHDRTYGPRFIPTGGKEFNLKNNDDVHHFMSMYWPGFDYNSGQWPSVYNALHIQGRVTREKAEEFACKLKAGHAVVAPKDLPH